MKGISIDGQKLHEVRMLTIPYSSDAVSYLVYPRSRIIFEKTDDCIVLCIPPMLAVELYRKGILPQNEEQAVQISISGKLVGSFRVSDFRYPNTSSDRLVTITLGRQANRSGSGPTRES